MLSKKNASDIFKNSIENQFVFNDLNIESMAQNLNSSNFACLRKEYKKHLSNLQLLIGLIGPQEISNILLQTKLPSNKILEKQFAHIYSLLQNNIKQFIDYLVNNNFTLFKFNQKDETLPIDKTIEKHKKLISFLFNQKDKYKKIEYLFTVANKFFEFCFQEKTFIIFKKLLSNKSYHPILRFLYSIIWSNLAETGWQHWHVDCIKALASSDKEIIYLAGGTDIYQLIKNGIYNIRIIDPLLPSQPHYYSSEWKWLIKGQDTTYNIGDEIIFDNIILKRTKYYETDKTFKIHLSTKTTKTIQQSTTIWNIYKNQKKMGHFIIERRPIQQNDFDTKNIILMSFNETYFIAATKEYNGWGINPHKLPQNFKMYVKQLKHPITKQILCNMRYEIKQKNFNYINLGSCIN